MANRQRDWRAITASLAFGLGVMSSAAAAMERVCFETSDNARLCYLERRLDDPAKPLLVFIPGWTMPATIWQRQLTHFAGRYPLVAFDPRGQGQSPAHPSGYTLERRVADIKELLERFPDRRVVLVAWSLAVLETLAYVAEHGEQRLAGLVLVDNSIGEGPDGPASTGPNPFFRELREQREATMRRFAAAIFRTPVDSGILDDVVTSTLQLPVEDSIRLLSYSRPRAFWRTAVHASKLPILYLVTPKWREQARMLTDQCPNARAVVFNKAGHALFWDQATAFNAALDDFLGIRAGSGN
ncbi:MAG TPA: alpha/beta hydrolase [Accumulibacter sp.]|nr:alpha/beta hydrolase [Accumulibacter sp.]